MEKQIRVAKEDLGFGALPSQPTAVLPFSEKGKRGELAGAKVRWVAGAEASMRQGGSGEGPVL